MGIKFIKQDEEWISAEEPSFKERHYRADPTRYAFWIDILELGEYSQLLEKLKEHAPEAVALMPECMMSPKDARTKAEEKRIWRAYKILASIVADFMDKFKRYREESKPMALDELKDNLMLKSALWKPYICKVEKKPKKED